MITAAEGKAHLELYGARYFEEMGDKHNGDAAGEKFGITRIEESILV